MECVEHVEYLLDCVREVEVEKGVSYLASLVTMPNDTSIVTEVIHEFMIEVGEHWSKYKDFSLADGYISSKIVISFLEEFCYEQVAVKEGHIAVFGNIKNDFQSSGRKLVIRYLEMSGWVVHDLGNDVSPEAFIESVHETGAKYIGVSSMLYENALYIKELVALLEDEFTDEQRPYLVAGGAVFNVAPHLAEELNVEYTASNAYEALELFNRLAGEV